MLIGMHVSHFVLILRGVQSLLITDVVVGYVTKMKKKKKKTKEHK